MKQLIEDRLVVAVEAGRRLGPRVRSAHAPGRISSTPGTIASIAEITGSNGEVITPLVMRTSIQKITVPTASQNQ